MEHPEARSTADDTIGVMENEAGTSTQALEFPNRRSEEARKSTDLGGNTIAKSGRSYENQKFVNVESGEPTHRDESLQNVLPPSQQAIILDASADRCKDLPKLTVYTSAASDKDACLSGVVTAQESPNVSTLSPGHVSLPEGNNTNMPTCVSIDSSQHDRGAGNLEEEVEGRAECSNKSTEDHDTTAEIVRSVSLPMDLQEALQSASQALEEEKQSEEHAFVVISSCLESVSSQSGDVKSSAVALFSEDVTIDDLDCSKCSEITLSRQKVDSRLKAVEDYVRAVYAEAFKKVDVEVSHLKDKERQDTSVSSNARRRLIPSTAVKGNGHSTCGKERPNGNQDLTIHSDKQRRTALLLHVLKLAADVRNAAVRQHQKLSKLYAIGELYVYKMEVSSRIVLNTAKSIANVVQPALEAKSVAQRAVHSVCHRGTPSTGGTASPAEHEVTVATEWTHLAVSEAEAAVRLHSEAFLVLKEALRKLELLKQNEIIAREVLHHSSAFEEYLLELIQQPRDIDFQELREKQTEVMFMRDMLPHILKESKECPAFFINLSETSSNTVANVLRALSVATQCSCCAMERSLDALMNVALSTNIHDEFELQ